jgi:hypothetical protein
MMPKRLGFLATILGAALTVILSGAPASAQATRTWVSGVGDDANSCSRTAPCKTFAGAISKTAPAGEINCLDPGGFGAVTITKSITIDCEESGNGGVLVSGTNGIVVAPNGGFVNLRGLDINGLGAGLSGVLINTSAQVTIKKTKIYGFTTAGINLAPSGGAILVVSDTAITNNNGSAVGIIVNGTTANANLTMRDVVVFSNSSHAVNVTTTGARALATIDRSTLAFNGGAGVNVSGANAFAFIGNTTITGNNNGVANAGGTLQSFKNNQITGNSVDGTPITAVPGGPLN